MYMIVFRSRKRPDMDAVAYAADDERMVELAAAQPGFISYNSFAAADGENVSISVWESEAHARAWGLHPEHAAVRERGWREYFESYTMFTIIDPQVKQFTRQSV